MRAPAVGWIALVAVACVSPFACTFLSDFPDVETDQDTSSSSSSSGGASGSGTSSTSTGDTTSSTGSGMCATPLCSDAACATPIAGTTLGFRTSINLSNVLSQGFATMNGDVFVSMSHKDPVEVLPGSVDIEGGLTTTDQFLYRVGDQPAFVARAYECRPSNGTLYSTPITATVDRFVFGLTSSGTMQNGDARLTVDRAATMSDNCASGTDGTSIMIGSLVPFLTTFRMTEGDQIILPATGELDMVGAGARASYQAVGGRGNRIAVLGVVPSGDRIFGQMATCAGTPECRFVASFDFSAGAPTQPELIEVLSDFGVAAGQFPQLDDTDADITIDEQGTIWAVATTSNAEVAIYRRAVGDLNGTLRRSEHTEAVRGRSIAVAGGRVYVAGSVIGDLTFGQTTRVGHSPSRDLFVAAFDANAFAPTASALWIAPRAGDEGFAVARDDDAGEVVVHQADGCAPAVYLTGCVGTQDTGGCNDGAPSNALVLRFDADGSRTRTTEIIPTGGWLAAKHLIVDPTTPRLWVSFAFDGTAFTFSSTSGIPATVVTALPL